MNPRQGSTWHMVSDVQVRFARMRYEGGVTGEHHAWKAGLSDEQTYFFTYGNGNAW